MQLKGNTEEAKRQRLEAVAAEMRKKNQKRILGTRGSMPTITAIARYWCSRDTFDLIWDTPQCFACHCLGHANGSTNNVEDEWRRSGLERCHLIAASAGGTEEISNLVLLCKRCHREAPMVGVSAEPMVAWIKRREQYSEWVSRRIAEECAAIKPTLLTECADLRLSDWHVAFDAVSNFLKLGLHPAGDHAAAIAQIIDGVVRLHKPIQLALGQRSGLPS